MTSGIKTINAENLAHRISVAVSVEAMRKVGIVLLKYDRLFGQRGKN